MRVLRLVLEHGAVGLHVIDELTGHRVPDVLRVEFAPLNQGERRLFATVMVHERGPTGDLLEADGQPVTTAQFVEMRIGNIWSV